MKEEEGSSQATPTVSPDHPATEVKGEKTNGVEAGKEGGAEEGEMDKTAPLEGQYLQLSGIHYNSYVCTGTYS